MAISAGQRFGRLEAIEPTPARLRRSVVWRFRCDCGEEIERPNSDVVHGNTGSCGCLGAELSGKRLAIQNVARTIHGHMRRGAKRSPTRISWEMMWNRCTKPKHKAYKDYGAKGITICDRWKSFANFLEDMNERPAGTTLDRFPNGAGNYEPTNCRWATPVEQGNNLKSNRPITFEGRTQNIKQWAAELGMSHQAINYRLSAGWTLKETFTRSVDHGNGWHRGVR
jgi:hypothetical protein